jgi:outer membrane immunogenic protein
LNEERLHVAVVLFGGFNMFRRTLALTAVAAAVAFTSTAANAADLPRRKAEPMAPASYVSQAFNWTGPYVGINLGGVIAEGKRGINNIDPTGVTVGLQAGYNYQFINNIVLGVEADVNYSNANDSVAGTKSTLDYFGTVRARAGYAMDRVLPYVTGGFAWGSNEVKTAALKQSKTHYGWTAGAGVEYAFTQNISARAEYLYMNLANENYTTFGVKGGVNAHIIRAGLNYKF